MKLSVQTLEVQEEARLVADTVQARMVVAGPIVAVQTDTVFLQWPADCSKQRRMTKRRVVR
eukprot:14677794-Heterocapsa_arctica.AAC.1